MVSDLYNHNERLYYPTVISTALGSISGFLYNYFSKRPVALGGIWKLPVGICAGYFIGDKVDKFLFDKRKLNYLIMMDYIQKHPSDFPELG